MTYHSLLVFYQKLPVIANFTPVNHKLKAEVAAWLCIMATFMLAFSHSVSVIDSLILQQEN